MNSPVARTEGEFGMELATLWEAVSKMASSLVWRTGRYVDVPVSHVMEEPTVKQSGDLPVLEVVEESTMEWIDDLPGCEVAPKDQVLEPMETVFGDGTEGSRVGVFGDVAAAIATPVVEARPLGWRSTAPRQNQYLWSHLGMLDLLGPEQVALRRYRHLGMKDHVLESAEMAQKGRVLESSEMVPKDHQRPRQPRQLSIQQARSLLVLGGWAPKASCR